MPRGLPARFGRSYSTLRYWCQKEWPSHAQSSLPPPANYLVSPSQSNQRLRAAIILSAFSFPSPSFPTSASLSHPVLSLSPPLLSPQYTQIRPFIVGLPALFVRLRRLRVFPSFCILTCKPSSDQGRASRVGKGLQHFCHHQHPFIHALQKEKTSLLVLGLVHPSFHHRTWLALQRNNKLLPSFSRLPSPYFNVLYSLIYTD